MKRFAALTLSLALTLLVSISIAQPVYADPIGVACTMPDGTPGKTTGQATGNTCTAGTPTAGSKNTASGGVNGEFALTCNDARSQNIISTTGFVSFFCSQAGNPANSSIIEVVIQQAVNWLSIFGSFIFAIMIALAGIQITTAGASPEGLKAGKKRLTLAISSLALLWGGNVFLGLVGISGRQFLGVPLDDFKIDTFNAIIVAVIFYLQFVSGALAVAFIMVGGVRMMTSAGNPQGIQAARKTITYALIGFAITISLSLIGAIIKMVITGSY